jgi:hypothetical protein
MSLRDDLFGLNLEEFGAKLDAVLSPASAIKSPEFLQGRDQQLTDVRQALAMKGRHVFIHGFRGVGKTSLAYTAAIGHWDMQSGTKARAYAKLIRHTMAREAKSLAELCLL